MYFTINQSQPNPNIEQLIELLTSVGGGQRSSVAVARLSDLSRAEVRALDRPWRAMPVEARRYLVRQMVDLAESNLEMNFSQFLRSATLDIDPEVRALAISGLWEDEGTFFFDQMLSSLTTEREPVVREAIAVALGRFAYLAALEELDDDRAARLRETLLGLIQPEEQIGVRRRALESLSYLPDDAEVIELISEAYTSVYRDLQVSALFAMGRNLDPRWFPTVLAELNSDDPEFRFEAARAIGEFGDQRAVDPLLSLVSDEDREVQTAAINALGQIGGRTAVSALRRLSREDDPLLRDAALDALDQCLPLDASMRPDLT